MQASSLILIWPCPPLHVAINWWKNFEDLGTNGVFHNYSHLLHLFAFETLLRRTKKQNNPHYFPCGLFTWLRMAISLSLSLCFFALSFSLPSADGCSFTSPTTNTQYMLDLLPRSMHALWNGEGQGRQLWRERIRRNFLIFLSRRGGVERMSAFGKMRRICLLS